MQQTESDEQVRCRWDCADVTRPLISTGITCDSGYEVLHTATQAVVVPERSFSKYLSNINVVQKFERRGNGLYTSKMRMKAVGKSTSGFARPSQAK